MKKLTFLFSLMLVSMGAISQTQWKADPFHSKIGFTVTHLGIADIPGHFGDFDVTITSAREDFSDAVVEMTIRTNSIDTRVEPRDNHLKSSDFFDVEKYPTMTFKSTSIKALGKNTYELTGNLTMHGITKKVKARMLYRGTTANPNADGAPVAGIQITAELDRSDFEIGNGFPPPMISNEVIIKADGEFGHKK